MQFSVKKAVHHALAENKAVTDALMPDNMRMPPTRERPTASPEAKPEADECAAADVAPASEPRFSETSKLSKLVDDDFPFDDSQLFAIHGMVEQKFACMTGAAGTGKTTSTKKLVDLLLDSTQLAIAELDIRKYHKSYDSDDETAEGEEALAKWVPAIVMCGFTGRSTQMIKKNFPTDWHDNIMTIHRMLGYRPEYYDDFESGENGEMVGVKKRRFVPSYTADNKMPWDIILIDEAGMLGLDLWHQIYAAMKDGCRVYMIGDINQLPPVHGRSIFGFAMANWPSFELTHVHRQKGKDNAIVDNAWRVLQGKMPVSGGNFQMIPLKGDVVMGNRMTRAMMPKLWKEKKVYEPNRDMIIVPINGETGARGYQLGQLTLNEQLSVVFNEADDEHRFFIDAGRERKTFAIGDKVMATKNDYEIGVTNGMTGVITMIRANGAYAGDTNRFNNCKHVREYLASDDYEEEDDDFTLESLSDAFSAKVDAKEAAKEKADRGPASHIITVDFGVDGVPNLTEFSTLSEVASLMTAYAATCHKMQGGECPTIVIVIHDVHRAMLYREWLYTAITRASQLCILLYTPDALRMAISKQNIKGVTLKQKIESFNELQQVSELTKRRAVNVRMPEAERVDGMPQLPSERSESKPTPREPIVKESPAPSPVHIHIRNATFVIQKGNEDHGANATASRPDSEERVVDGGEISAQESNPAVSERPRFLAGPVALARIPSASAEPAARLAKPFATLGAVRVMQAIADVQEHRLLPAPKQVEKPASESAIEKPKFKFSFGKKES